MSDPARRRAAYQDVLDAPPEKIAEVINGELYLSRPGLQQCAVTTGLIAMLGRPFDLGIDGPGGWTLLYAPELHLGDDIVVPDLAAWRYERMPVVDDAPFETLAPDWICETLSASTEKLDRQEKLPIYAAAGVAHAWLAHPVRRTLEVFQLRGGRWQTVDMHQRDQRVRAEPFAAIELDISMLWLRLAPPRSAASAS